MAQVMDEPPQMVLRESMVAMPSQQGRGCWVSTQYTPYSYQSHRGASRWAIICPSSLWKSKVFMWNVFLIDAGESKVSRGLFRRWQWVCGGLFRAQLFMVRESWRKLNEYLRMSYLLAYHLHGELHGVEGKPYKINCWSLTLEFDVLIAFPISASTTAVAYVAIHFCSDLGHHFEWQEAMANIVHWRP